MVKPGDQCLEPPEQLGVLTKAHSKRGEKDFCVGLYYMRDHMVVQAPPEGGYVVALPHPCAYGEVICSGSKVSHLGT